MEVTAIFAMVLLASMTTSALPQPDADRSLTANAPIERQIAARESHRYTVDASAGELLRLDIGQDAIDLIVRVADPSGQVVLETDNFDWAQRLSVEWIASAAGAAGRRRSSTDKKPCAWCRRSAIRDVKAKRGPRWAACI